LTAAAAKLNFPWKPQALLDLPIASYEPEDARSAAKVAPPSNPAAALSAARFRIVSSSNALFSNLRLLTTHRFHGWQIQAEKPTVQGRNC